MLRKLLCKSVNYSRYIFGKQNHGHNTKTKQKSALKITHQLGLKYFVQNNVG